MIDKGYMKIFVLYFGILVIAIVDGCSSRDFGNGSVEVASYNLIDSQTKGIIVTALEKQNIHAICIWTGATGVLAVDTSKAAKARKILSRLGSSTNLFTIMQ